jgi:hypothetical protein
MLLWYAKQAVDGLVVETPKQPNQINGLETHVVFSLNGMVVYNGKFKDIPALIASSLSKAFPTLFDMNMIEKSPAYEHLSKQMVSRAREVNDEFNRIITKDIPPTA